MAIKLPLLSGTLLIALLASGCAAKQSASLQRMEDVKASASIDGVPFYPQLDFQCGPASLAMLLNHAGVEVTPDQLQKRLFIPGRKGSLQPEMKATARSFGLIAYPVAPKLADILQEIESGHPVLVLQNLGLKVAPQWHYAVVTGYHLAEKEIRLHSGDRPDYRMPISTFEHTWVRAGSWALVVQPAGTFPTGAEEISYLQASVDLEHGGHTTSALRAYRAAVARWPDSLAAWMGLGNMYYSMADFEAAAAAFSRAAALHVTAAEPLNNLALVRMEQFMFDQALQAIDKAISLDDNSDLYQQTRIEILRTKAQFEGGAAKRQSASETAASVDNSRYITDNSSL